MHVIRGTFEIDTDNPTRLHLTQEARLGDASCTCTTTAVSLGPSAFVDLTSTARALLEGEAELPRRLAEHAANLERHRLAHEAEKRTMSHEQIEAVHAAHFPRPPPPTPMPSAGRVRGLPLTWADRVPLWLWALALGLVVVATTAAMSIVPVLK